MGRFLQRTDEDRRFRLTLRKGKLLPGILFGNANHGTSNPTGWFVGHFIDPPEDPRATRDLEIKWHTHPAGEQKTSWTKSTQATSLAILISGRFIFQLSRPAGSVDTAGGLCPLDSRYLPYLAGRGGVGHSHDPLAVTGRGRRGRRRRSSSVSLKKASPLIDITRFFCSLLPMPLMGNGANNFVYIRKIRTFIISRFKLQGAGDRKTISRTILRRFY